MCSSAEQFSKLAHLLLSEQVIVGHAVFRCHVGGSVLLKATSLCFKNLLSTFYPDSEGELNSYCLADFRVFSPQDKTLICVHSDSSLQLPVKEMPFRFF